MCIYCGTAKYRKIYEEHYGPIPTDELGRTYHIHHKDGHHHNNDPKNLVALSMQAHYDAHYDRGDWLACLRMAPLLTKSKDELSLLASKAQRIRVLSGTHNLLGARNPVHQRVANGIQSSHFRELANKRMKMGTHPSQKMRTCPQCGHTGKGPAIFRTHFDRCYAKRLTKIKPILTRNSVAYYDSVSCRIEVYFALPNQKLIIRSHKIENFDPLTSHGKILRNSERMLPYWSNAKNKHRLGILLNRISGKEWQLTGKLTENHRHIVSFWQ